MKRLTSKAIAAPPAVALAATESDHDVAEISNIRRERTEERREERIVQKCRNAKINKFMEDINRKATQKDIVLLLIDIAERPEISLDYNISIQYYLSLYLQCREEPILSEAGCLILNAASIYSRRVDHICQLASRSVGDIDEASKPIIANVEDNAAEFEDNADGGGGDGDGGGGDGGGGGGDGDGVGDGNEKEKTVASHEPKKRASKKLCREKDYFYESDMIIPKFKISTDEKLCDKPHQINTFEPPDRYIDNIEKYKEWKSSKRQKNKAYSTSINFNEHYIDPILWQYSKIQDFEYDDDVDTKRNYRVFTNVLDYRYSTLEPDIDFVMHYKLKDFIEAEEKAEEENEMTTSELLPSSAASHPAKRKWPPICGYSTSSEHNYFDVLIDLENKILEKEADNELIEEYGGLSLLHKRRKRDHNDMIVPLINDMDDMSDDLSQDSISLPEVAAAPPPSSESSPEIHSEIVPELSSQTAVAEATEEITPEIISEEVTPEPEITPEEVTAEIITNDATNINENNTEIASETITESEMTEPEIFDPLKVIVRLSTEDEGVYFGDLDDIDRAMLSPRVVATDITQSMTKDIANLSKLIVKVDEELEKFCGIDDAFHLKYENNNNNNININLIDKYRENIKICYNLLKLPEKILRKRCLFRLTKKYDLFKKDRMRKSRIREIKPRIYLNLFKLNDSDANIIGNRSNSPLLEPDFWGFNDVDITTPPIVQIDKNINEIVSLENMFGKIRSTSLDSGIEFTDLLAKQITNNNLSLIDESEFNENLVLHSTAIENTCNTSEIINNTNNNIELSKLPNNNEQLNSTSTDERNLITETDQNVTANDSGIASCSNSLLINNNSTNESQNNTQQSNSNNNSKIEYSDNIYKMNDLALKIQKWHRRLKPVLERSKERHHFDVFEMGTEIINHFPTDAPLPSDTNVTFEDVMKDKDPSYTSRYFLSMLLLANSNNIAINVNNNHDYTQPTDSKDIQMQLVNRKRHTVSVEDNIGLVNKNKRVCIEESIKRPTETIKTTETINTIETTETTLFRVPPPKVNIVSVTTIKSKSICSDDSGYLSNTSTSTNASS